MLPLSLAVMAISLFYSGRMESYGAAVALGLLYDTGGASARRWRDGSAMKSSKEVTPALCQKPIWEHFAPPD